MFGEPRQRPQEFSQTNLNKNEKYQKYLLLRVWSTYEKSEKYCNQQNVEIVFHLSSCFVQLNLEHVEILKKYINFLLNIDIAERFFCTIKQFC